jgi:hypothetical protein
MKKSVLVAAAIVAVTAASAQTGEITSNRGENWLSQDGDWGLTFDAQPIFHYVGNLFNNGTNGENTMQLTWANPMFAIQGKKLIDANTAYRGKLRIGFGSHTTTELVEDLTPNAAADATVEDRVKMGNFNLVLGAGLEKRVGSSRVVGVYGAEAMVALGSNKTTYEYGNAATGDNPVQGRVTEAKGGSTFGFGLGAFAGIEWFFAPKMSVGGEYTWGLMLNSTGFGETTTESWNFTNNNITTTVTEGPTGKESRFALDTGISGVAINLNFYFQ